MWHNVSYISKTINSAKRIRSGRKTIRFSCWFDHGKEREERKKEIKNLFLRSVGRNSSSQELKFIYSTRAKREYQNRRISLKDPKEVIWGNRRFRA